MKKIFLLAISILSFTLTSCGSDSNENLQPQEIEVVKDSIPTLEGEFIFLSDAAVIKGKDFIYGVNIDSLSLDLAEQVKKYKKDEFDMIPVKVKAKIIPNPGTIGWEENIEIREVLSISAPTKASEKDTIK